MLAPDTPRHADLPKRERGQCQTCAFRTVDPDAGLSFGNPITKCSVHGFRVLSRYTACLSYRFADRDTPERRKYLLEYMRAYRAAATERKLERLDAPPEPQPTVTYDRCPRCGSAMLYPDDDGQGCACCGFHSWASAREPLAAFRPYSDGLPFFAMKSRKWDER